jgi:hypothetical protein
VQGRLDILRNDIVRKKIPLIIIDSLGKKIPKDSERNIEIYRMYNDLIEEEKQHVERFHELILQ